MATEPSVPCLFGVPRQKSYRLAISDCLRRVKREHGLTLVELAEKLGCSDHTLRNALDEDGTDCLNPVTMLRLGFEFGEDVIEPVFALARRAIAEPQTLTDKLDALQGQMAAVRREIGA